MSIYKLQKSQNGLLDKLFSKAGIIIFAFLVLVLIFFFGTGSYSNFFIYAFVLAIVVLSFYRGMRLQRKYEVEINSTSIIQRKSTAPTMIINLSDIEYILALKNGGILIKQKDSENHILIPAGIENKEDIINTLDSVIPVTKPVKEFPNYKWLILSVMLLTVGLFYLFIYSSNKLLIISTGPILLAIHIWGFISIQKTDLVDKKIKLSGYLIILPFITVLWKTAVSILDLLGYRF